MTKYHISQFINFFCKKNSFTLKSVINCVNASVTFTVLELSVTFLT